MSWSISHPRTFHCSSVACFAAKAMCRSLAVLSNAVVSSTFFLSYLLLQDGCLCRNVELLALCGQHLVLIAAGCLADGGGGGVLVGLVQWQGLMPDWDWSPSHPGH
ncbi:hypothetical protein V8C86DRAFT_1613589 [Haematococcus lacustris]